MRTSSVGHKLTLQPNVRTWLWTPTITASASIRKEHSSHAHWSCSRWAAVCRWQTP